MDSTVSDVYSDPEEMVKKLEAAFKSKTRDEWSDLFLGQDACVTPVLDMEEAVQFPHHKERKAFVKEGERWQAEAAPKFFSAEEFKKLGKSKL